MVQAQVGSHKVWAVLHLGCAQSLVRAELVTPCPGRRATPVRVSCLHGETQQIQQQWVSLQGMEHQGELLVGLAPRLACEMLLGREWPPLYDTLERVRDRETAKRELRNREGWVGESEERVESDGDPKMVDLQAVASSCQFKKAQEEEEGLQKLQTFALDDASAPQARTAPTHSRLEV